MPQPILVVVEHREGRLNPASLESITAAQQMAQQTSAPVMAAVLAGEKDGIADQIAKRKLDRVVRAVHPALARYSPDAFVQALVQIISELKPDYVLFPHTYQVRDYAPRLATRMGRGLITDCIGFRMDAGRLVVSRLMFQGKLAADVSFTGAAPYFVTFQIGAFRGDQAAAGTTPTAIQDIQVSPEQPRMQAEARFKEAKQAVDLTQADIIVAVGRGIKEPKNLDMVKQLADALGAEIGASRPICDNGWLPMDRQVGSSGQTVSPKLYVAVGISGAIQHLVGMKGSRAVVAINKDPEAPIFEVADYAVVGNLFDIVPALTDEIKKAKA
jgi:electron transfer flavoprotein alpha subunit